MKLHRLLTPEHFDGSPDSVPPVWRLREQLNGVGLTWELAEAVADICFPAESVEEAARRLDRVRCLWDTANTSPTEPQADPTSSLVEAQQKAIRALEELNRVRQAYEVSEQARMQALQVATVLFALLGQTQAQVAQLARQLDALRAAESPRPVDERLTASRLERAQKQTEDLRLQLARAEEDRDRAQQVADLAARQISALEEELRDLRPDAEPGDQAPGGAQVELPGQGGTTADDDALDQIDAALQKARDVLDREHEAVREAAEDVGWRESRGENETGPKAGEEDEWWVVGEAGHHSGVVPGQVVRDDPPVRDHDGTLFGTTSDNPPASANAAGPGTELAVRRENDRFRFVGAATRRISRGIDLDEIVLGLCRATVPTFSDAILVHLRDPLPVGDERPVTPYVLRLRRADALSEAETENEALAAALDPTTSTGVCEVDPGGALSEVLRGVRPVFGVSAEARAALRELLGPGAGRLPASHRVILAPLRGRRRVIGTIVFLRHSERIGFDPNDLLVAAQLATHTAIGIDKAVLYGRESYIAGELQRTMLPASLPQTAGVRLAARYLPAAETARVGGDWYDAIPLSSHRVALVVGDVMGHSMTSAAIMGQLRTTAQTLADLDLPPDEILRRLDRQAQALGPDRIATCIYVVYDPDAHRITVANAGHPPPVMLHLDGSAEVLGVPRGAPIGVGGVAFQAVELDAPPGATLLLYTDGLVESRLRDVYDGVERLREHLAAAARLTGPDRPPLLEELCDSVLDMLGPGDRDDDIALLAARFEGVVPGGVA
ncbi:SpoIIE family protein phosphatase [Streptomyces sp. NPDC051840]|uniref:PP2C family protein-serine/threonine phosphatase n=1 Tax=Streptomyces sp. NPDC051840 TaxID=3154752 RepID=UPI00342580D9